MPLVVPLLGTDVPDELCEVAGICRGDESNQQLNYKLPGASSVRAAERGEKKNQDIESFALFLFLFF